MTAYLGKLNIFSDGTIEFDQRTTPGLTLDQLGLVYRAAVGARAATKATSRESVVHLAASLLAKAGAEKARERRAEVAAGAKEAVSA